MSTDPATILVTGATGKVGQAFLRRFLADPAFKRFKVRALCHNRLIPAEERVKSCAAISRNAQPRTPACRA